MVGYLTNGSNDLPLKHISISATINGVTPKNKKCFCYPYCFLKITNNSGEEKTLKWENFNYSYSGGQTGRVEIKVDQCLSQSPIFSAMPRYYEGFGSSDSIDPDNPHYIVQYNNFPQLPWNYNAYQNWFALNSNSILFGFLGKGLSTALSVGTGNFEGALGAGVNAMGEWLSMLDKKKQPEQTRGNVQGNLMAYIATAGLYAEKYEAKAEYIVMIDEFFSHYGYLVNETKVPTFHKRPNFDYIKTRDINIVEDIPQEDIEELENIFNDGVTVWHNINTYGDYNVNNAPT